MTAIDFASFVDRLAIASREATLPFFRTALGNENKAGACAFDPFTAADRASETTRLLEWGFSSSTNTTIFKPGDTVAEAPVWLGAQDKVPLVASRSVQVTTPTGQTANPRVVAKFDGPLPAPIAKGTKLGSAAVTLPDGRVMEFPLEAGVDVPRQGLIGRVGALARFYLLGWLS